MERLCKRVADLQSDHSRQHCLLFRDRFKEEAESDDVIFLLIHMIFIHLQTNVHTPFMLRFLPSAAFTDRESRIHFFSWGYAVGPWLPLRFLPTSLLLSWLHSRHHGQDLSFLRAFHSLSLLLGTPWILHIWLLLNLHVSAKRYLRETLPSLRVPLPLLSISYHCLISFIVLIIAYDNLSSKIWYLCVFIYCLFPSYW